MSYEERKLEYLIDSEMDYLKQFSMIIISRISKPLAERIRNMANGWNIPVMQIESFGGSHFLHRRLHIAGTSVLQKF